MENCNVKKYMKVADNNNLEYLGYVKARISMSSAATLRFNKKVTLILLDGTWKNPTDPTKPTELVVNANTSVYPSSSTINPPSGASYVGILIPKYSCYYYGALYPYDEGGVTNLTGFKFGSADDATDLLINFTILNNHFKIDGLQYAPLNKAYQFQIANGAEIVGEPLDLTQLGAGGQLTNFAVSASNLTGTLDNMGKSNVTTINNFPNTKAVSIDLVNYVANHRAAGRTTGTQNLKYVGSCTVKANGVVLDIPSEGTNTLTWTADSITFRGNPIS
jgi:hypothetical protein